MDEKNCTNSNGDHPTGKVYLVGGGPGEPDLLTLRGLDFLRKAEGVVSDLVDNKLLRDYAR